MHTNIEQIRDIYLSSLDFLILLFWRDFFFVLDDTSNFDEFPDVDLKIPSATSGSTQGSKDWVFINYTFKRFEGLTQRGPIPKI